MFFTTKPATTNSTRHYYDSSDQLFEKSLDIYKPLAPSNSNLPVVILVVGSGWVGHRAILYSGCSWWNASGPQTIAGLGCTCVCIRHRGAFCVLPSMDVIVQYLVLVLAVVGAATNGQWEIAITVTVVVAGIIGLLALGARGSASDMEGGLEQMWDDVAQALRWIQDHPEELLLESPKATPSLAATETTISSDSAVSREESISGFSVSGTSRSGSSDVDSEWEANGNNPSYRNTHNTVPPMIFGGYSSGGHVAATLLQQPQVFSRHNLPAPVDLFEGIFMISAMMAVRPCQITVHPKGGSKSTAATKEGAPRWLTDFVVNLVWGYDGAKRIPSPLTLGNPPELPHLLVGCKNEMFGIDWLDVYFCSEAFAKSIANRNHAATYHEVESDHWNILNSTALRDVLEMELPKLVVAATAGKFD